MSVVAVVGLGYVGLPLAVEFGKKMTTIGYDLSVEKVEHYRRFCDPTGEVSTDDLKAATQLTVTTHPAGPGAYPRFLAAGRFLHHRRQVYEKRRNCHLLIYILLRRHR